MKRLSSVTKNNTLLLVLSLEILIPAANYCYQSTLAPSDVNSATFFCRQYTTIHCLLSFCFFTLEMYASRTGIQEIRMLNRFGQIWLDKSHLWPNPCLPIYPSCLCIPRLFSKILQAEPSMFLPPCSLSTRQESTDRE